MSYDIELIDKHTGKTVLMSQPSIVRGGTVQAVIEPASGKLVQTEQTEAHINITYNYSGYYYDALKDDFGEDNNGIRTIYGMGAIDSISILVKMVENIRAKYTDKDGKWVMSKRTKIRYYDENGNDIDLFTAILEDKVYTGKDEEYTISEGDKTNYWESTAANAIDPLNTMIYMAIQCHDAIWSGD